MKAKDTRCPAEYTLALIGGRWKIPLIFHLLADKKRFSELSRAVDGVTQKVSTQQLREMERDGLVERQVYAQVPPKVEYSLTELGMSLQPVVDAMCLWGETYGGRKAPRKAEA
jgi:DNA-binding HxlR family transcriptional regulator